MTTKKSHKGAALITGGAKRIGETVALKLAEKGYDIAIHYKDSRAQADRVARTVRPNGVRCEIFACDLNKEPAVKKLTASVKKKFGNLNLLVNNASIFEKSKLDAKSVDSLKKHFSVNFISPYILSCEFARLCGGGQIINILDTHIVQNRSTHPGYLLSKKALADLTKMAALAFAPRIRVNGIAPGLILPPPGAGKGHLKRLSQNIPMRKKGHPEQIASAINFLLENEYITGQIIFNDGGEHLI